MRNKLVRFIVLIVPALMCSALFAAKDPISWSLNATFPAQVQTGHAYTIIYTLTNQIPFQLVNPLVIEKNASPASEFFYVDNCTGVRLAPAESCTVEVTLIPLISGGISFQLSIAGYDNNVVPLPELITVAGGSPSGVDIIANIVTPLTDPLVFGSQSNYKFSFTNQGSVDATIVSGTASVLGFISNCGPQLLAGQSCEVSGTYTPTSSQPSMQSVTATLNYAEGSPVSITSYTTVTSPGGVVGVLILPLPPVMVNSTSANFSIKFCNEFTDSIDITGSSTVLAPTSPTGGTIILTHNCASGTLASTGCCGPIEGTYAAPTAGTRGVTLTSTLTYTHLSTPSLTASKSTQTSIGTVPTQRIFNLTNHCGFPVWASMSGGAIGNQSGVCPGTACPSGSSCDTSTGVCFWKNYTPASGNQINKGASTTITITDPSTDPTIEWSGGISASLGCTPSTPSGTCAQASCDNANGSTNCAPGKGFTTPSAQAEFTLLLNNIDSYDVTVINGLHIPIEMKPTPPATVDNYSCGAAGGNPQTPGFGICQWTRSSAITPANQYNWILPLSSHGTCTATTSACTSGSSCGLSSSFQLTCGTFLGFWTGDEVCGSAGVPTDIRALFQCNVPLATLSSIPSYSPIPPGYTPPLTLQDLMQCAVNADPSTGAAYQGPIFNTCYKVYTGYSSAQVSSCCGCVDWWNTSYQDSAVLSNSAAPSCSDYGSSNQNPDWASQIQPTLIWMKWACPSAYVYPFDDKTSTFTCTNNTANAPNTMNYDITFCPNGDTGLPPGATEGRQRISVRAIGLDRRGH